MAMAINWLQRAYWHLKGYIPKVEGPYKVQGNVAKQRDYVRALDAQVESLTQRLDITRRIRHDERARLAILEEMERND